MNKKSKLIAIITLLIVSLAIIGGLLIKTVILNPPDQTPREIAKEIVNNINDDDSEANREFFSEDFEFEDVDAAETADDEEDFEIVAKTIEENINDDEAEVIQEWDFVLVKLNVEFRFQQEGNWLSGYQWKVVDIITPELEDQEESQEDFSIDELDQIELQIGDKAEFSSIEYTIESINTTDLIEVEFSEDIRAEGNTTFLVVEMAITNLTDEPIQLGTNEIFYLEDDSGRTFNEYEDSFLIDNSLQFRELSPSIPESGVVVYEIPSDIESVLLATRKQDTDEVYVTRYEL
jgi:hypothetical protein